MLFAFFVLALFGVCYSESEDLALEFPVPDQVATKDQTFKITVSKSIFDYDGSDDFYLEVTSKPTWLKENPITGEITLENSVVFQVTLSSNGDVLFGTTDTDIEVIDVSNNQDPKLLDVSMLSGDYKDVIRVNDDLYVVGHEIFTIIDVSDVEQPNTRFFTYSYGGHGVAVSDDMDYVFLSDQDHLFVFDISDIVYGYVGSVVEQQFVFTSTNVPKSTVFVDDGIMEYLLVADGEIGLIVVNVTSKVTGEMNLVDQYVNVNNQIDDIAISSDKNYAYIADSGLGFRILDISQRDVPTLVGSLMHPDIEPRCLKVIGDYVYIGDVTGFKIVDVSDKEHPILVKSYEPEDQEYYTTGLDVTPDQTYAYTAVESLEDGVVRIFDLANLHLEGKCSKGGDVDYVEITARSRDGTQTVSDVFQIECVDEGESLEDDDKGFDAGIGLVILMISLLFCL